MASDSPNPPTPQSDPKGCVFGACLGTSIVCWVILMVGALPNLTQFGRAASQHGLGELIAVLVGLVAWAVGLFAGLLAVLSSTFLPASQQRGRWRTPLLLFLGVVLAYVAAPMIALSAGRIFE